MRVKCIERERKRNAEWLNGIKRKSEKDISMTNLATVKEMIKNKVVKGQIGNLLDEMKCEVIGLKIVLPYTQEYQNG